MGYDEDIQQMLLYLQSLKISINVEEFKIQLESHPDYPSLLTLSDTLTFFNIPNKAVRVSNDGINSLPNSFIALLGESHQTAKLKYVEKYSNIFKIHNKEINENTIKQLWKDVVLVAQKYDNFENKPSKKIKSSLLLIVGSTIFILGVIFGCSKSLLSVLFGLISVTGVYFSTEALKTELGIESKVSQSFCNAIPNADCGKVITSNKSKWLQNFKISDLSIWFFTAQLFALLLFSVAGFTGVFFSYMLAGLFLAVPLTLYYRIFSIQNREKVVSHLFKHYRFGLCAIGSIGIQFHCVFIVAQFQTSFPFLI